MKNLINFRFKFSFLLFFGLLLLINGLPVEEIIKTVASWFFIWCSCWSLSRFLLEKFYISKDVENKSEKAILITGCDSGFGLATSIKLSNQGYHVFSGCLTESEGFKKLENYSKTSKGKLSVFILDVTSDESVDKCYDYVVKNLGFNERLWAVINNAGIGIYHGFNWDTNSAKNIYYKTFNVNVFGVIRISQKFTPLLMTCPDSRFILMSSYAGRFTFPVSSSYCMSKHSIRVLGNSMRKELKNYDVKVVIIEPTMYKTGITDLDQSIKVMEHYWNQTDASLKKKLGNDYYSEKLELVTNFMRTTNPNVDDVLNIIDKAVNSINPYPFYRVSTNFQKMILYFFELFPEEVQEYVLDSQIYEKLLKLVKLIPV